MNSTDNTYNVTNYGAVGDGHTLDTRAIQKAIDACSASGGGIIRFPSGGRYLIGTIYLKSYVTMDVAPNAVILGSTDLKEYADDTGLCPYYPEPLDRCLIYAKGAVGITFTGSGTIDGQFVDEQLEKDDDPLNSSSRVQRPMLIRMEECSDISMENLTVQGAFSWCIHIKHCENIKLRGMTVLNDRQDGFNIEGSRNIAISDCTMRCGDDGIALTTSRKDRPLSGLTVTNCTISSRWAAFRIGPLSKGDFENIVMSNCVLKDCGGGGIKIGMFEGAAVRNCIFSSLVMEQVTAPILIMNARWTDIGSIEKNPPMMPPGIISELMFSDIIIRAHAGPTPPWDVREYEEDEIKDFLLRPDRNSTIYIQGHREGKIESIALRNIRMELPGGEQANEESLTNLTDMHEIDIAENGYWTDDKTIWGIPVASALFARHAGSLSIKDLTVTHRETEERAPLAFVDCGSIRLSEIEVDGRGVSDEDILVHNCNKLGMR